MCCSLLIDVNGHRVILLRELDDFFLRDQIRTSLADRTSFDVFKIPDGHGIILRGRSRPGTAARGAIITLSGHPIAACPAAFRHSRSAWSRQCSKRLCPNERTRVRKRKVSLRSDAEASFAKRPSPQAEKVRSTLSANLYPASPAHS